MSTLRDFAVAVAVAALIVTLMVVSKSSMAQHGLATIIVPVAGEWSVVQGYIVTDPDGNRLACEIGQYLGDPTKLDFECSPFVDPQPYSGNNVTGELTLK